MRSQAPARSTCCRRSPSRCRSRSSPSCSACRRPIVICCGRGRPTSAACTSSIPSDEDRRVATRASVEFSDYLRALSRRAPRRADRRPHQRDGARARRGRPPHRGRAHRHVRAAAERRPRGDRERHRERVVGAASVTPRRSLASAPSPDLVPTAVEELMRWDTPLQLFERWVLEDVEIHGVQLPRGAELGLLFGSANRDPVGVRVARRAAARSRPEPPRDVRRRHPLLPRGAAGPSRAADLVRDGAPPSAGLEPVEEPEWKPGYIIRGLASLRVAA